MKNPKIRFTGFTGDWEQHKLGEVLVDYTEKNPIDEVLPVLTSSRQGIQSQEKHFGRVQQHDITDYNVIPLGYCTYRNRSDDKSFVFNVNDSFERGIVSKFYPVFTFDGCNAKFMTVYMNSNPKITNDISILAVGTSQVVLSISTLKGLKLLLPSEDEQDKIGQYLKTIDTLITLYQKKCEDTKALKKYMLQKMFPQNGSNIPEIRFSGFTNAWEKRKLGELSLSFEYGLNAAAKEFDGKNKYIRITDIDDSSHEFLANGVTSPDIDLSVEDNYKLAIGDILFARTGASVGKTYIYKESDGLIYFAGFLIRARIKKEFNPEFVFHNTLTEDYAKYITITSQRSGQPGVNAQEYSEYSFMVPNRAEQDKISNYFNSLDHLITLHQRKCTELQKIKKFMLQNMFV